MPDNPEATKASDFRFDCNFDALDYARATYANLLGLTETIIVSAADEFDTA